MSVIPFAKKSNSDKSRVKQTLKAIAYFTSAKDDNFHKKPLMNSQRKTAKKTSKKPIAKRIKRGVASEVRSARGSRYAKRIYR